MVGADRWRDPVAWTQRAYQLPQRRAFRAVGTARASIRYASGRPPQTALCRRLREIAEVRVHYGYRRMYVLLRREGWTVNHKRVDRTVAIPL